MYSTTYTSHTGACLRIISINTMFWEGVNWWIYNTTMPRDPSNVLAFLVSQLQVAEDNGERAWVIGHIPPGRPDALYDYSSYLDQVTQRYDATIAAMFWGHTHRDQFEVSYIDYMNRTANNARMVGYIAPSLTPTSGNPNFRVYEVDPVTFGIRDYTVYYSNLSAPDYHIHGPKWEELYSFRSAYAVAAANSTDYHVHDPHAELTPAFMHNVTTLFENDDAVFQQYWDRKQRGYTPAGYGLCVGSCKTNEICQLRSAQSQFACLAPSAALRRKRAVGEIEMEARVLSECSRGERMVEVLHAVGKDVLAKARTF
jgi:sphingomyelin phosphodiesterase